MKQFPVRCFPGLGTLLQPASVCLSIFLSSCSGNIHKHTHIHVSPSKKVTSVASKTLNNAQKEKTCQKRKKKPEQALTEKANTSPLSFPLCLDKVQISYTNCSELEGFFSFMNLATKCLPSRSSHKFISVPFLFFFFFFFSSTHASQVTDFLYHQLTSPPLFFLLFSRSPTPLQP